MLQHLRIGNDLDSLRDMSVWIAASCKALDFPEAVSYHLDLAANEAVANAISYGYPQGARGAIDLRIGKKAGQAILEIEDDGVPFNPLELAEPPRVQTLEESRIGGLGVPLIRRSIAQCDYQRRDGRNLLILRSPISGA